MKRSTTFKACPSNRWFGNDKSMRVFVRDCIKDAFNKGQSREQFQAALKPELRTTAGEMYDYYKKRDKQQSDSFEVKAMPEPVRSLFLDACKITGDMNRAIEYMEESLTKPMYVHLTNFVTWLKSYELTVGWGTVDLRWTEYNHALKPMSKEMAYEFAMAKELTA